MKAESRTLQRIFEQSIRYCVPLFQRPYVWNQEDNWEPLWEDIRRLAEQPEAGTTRRTHFIGAIVLELLTGATGSIETRQVIDGQQRLTTLQILLTVLKNISQENGWSNYFERFKAFTQNNPAFIDIAEHSYKVWPTNPDRASYSLVIDAGTPTKLNELQQEAIADHRQINAEILKCYTFFWNTINSWLKESDGSQKPDARMEILWQVLSSQLRLVTIDLEPEDDAQVIFETLNSRGAPLLPADLVKNYLFRLAEAGGKNVEKLYEKQWKQFDGDEWRQIIKQGRLSRPKLDIFFQHFITMNLLQDILITHIFESYKKYAKSSSKAPEVLIEELTKYGKVFERILSPHTRPKIRAFQERLSVVDTNTVYPLLLEVFQRYDNPEGYEELEKILAHLESFLMRRMICRKTTKNYNRFFLTLLSDLKKSDKCDANAISTLLLKSDADANKWPTDDEFRHSMLEEPLYDRLAVAKVERLLKDIDSTLETGKTEQITLTGHLTVEHLLPQTWMETWPIIESDPVLKIEKEKLREATKHTLGNLTLLTSPLNSSISNGPWDKKQPEIVKQSKLNMNREFHGVTAWDEPKIHSRGERLANIAISLWPVPK